MNSFVEFSGDIIKAEKLVISTFSVRPDEVLVVIPALNEASHIEACLRSIIESDPFCEGVKIAVVDGGSTDGTQVIVDRMSREFPNIRLVDNPDKIQSAGINKAVSVVADKRTQIIVRCDAHAVYPEGYVRRVVETFAEHPEAGSVVGVLDSKGENCFQRASSWIVDTPLGSGGSAHRGGTESGWVDHGHHAGFRIEWFRHIGGYDASFSHNEDAEYDHRLGLAGGRVWLDAGLRTDYVMRPTPRGLWLQYWRYGRGRARTILKHRMKPRLRQMVPALSLAIQFLCLLVALVWPPALGIPAFYFGALVATSAVAAFQMRSACGLWAGVAEFIIHNAWATGFLWQLAKGHRRK